VRLEPHILRHTGRHCRSLTLLFGSMLLRTSLMSRNSLSVC